MTRPLPAALAHPRDPAPNDPLAWCVLIPLAFGIVAAWRLGLPSQPYFDEVHYIPAAREVLRWWQTGEGGWLNPEHPPLGKYLIALGMAVLGDNAVGWRIMPLVAAIVALGAGMRALWHASESRFACVAFGLLMASGFALLVHARIAMLDIFMAAFLLLAASQFAAAIREPETGRWRLALTGVMLGCALASKWNAAPLAVLPGLTFLIARALAGRRRLLLSRRGAPVPGITLIEAFGWLGIVPLVVYALTFLPACYMGTPLRPSLVSEHGLIGAQLEMLRLQSSVVTPHTYMSTWPQWVLNTRGIWYLYEFADGAQRGVLLIGNPLTMLAGLPALLWCGWRGVAAKDWARLACAIGYVVSLSMWVIAPKPVQFYYHYMMPGTFLLAALALTLADLKPHPRVGWMAWGAIAGSLALCAVFLPILSAAPLEGPGSFARWMWLEGWR